MAAPIVPVLAKALKYAGKQMVISTATNKETRNKTIAIIASVGASIILLPFILIIVVIITISSAMSTFFDDVKSFLRLEWTFSSFESDYKTEIEEEIEAWFQGLSQGEKDVLGRQASDMREWLIDQGLVIRVDDSDVLYIDGYVHKRLCQEEINSIVQGVQDERLKLVVRWAAEKVGMPYSQILRSSGTHFDCSSFIYYAYMNIGVNISFGGVNTAHQIARGMEVKNKTFTDLSKLKPGDLIFSSNRSDASRSRYLGITHVVMYVGNGMIIDAQSTQAGVTYRRLPNYSKSSLVFAARPL